MVYDELIDDDQLAPNDDVLLTHEHVQALRDPDGIALFFAELHYNTNSRVQQTLSALNGSSDKLDGKIQHIEQIAYNEDYSQLAVYLFQVSSLTTSIRNDIVQLFRAKDNSDYLLVLTDTYDRLDFILLERYSPSISTSAGTVQLQALFNNKQTHVRPHVLQVERLDPGPIALRVLRRFTYTESDTLAQYEKLRGAYEIATWSERYFNNRALFSDYYLTDKNRFPDLDEFKGTQAISAMTQGYRRLRTLYEDASLRFRNKPEALIRKDLLEPALAILALRLDVLHEKRALMLLLCLIIGSLFLHPMLVIVRQKSH